MTTSSFDRAQQSAAAVRGAIGSPPPRAIVLGSGMGSLAERFSDQIVIPYDEIRHFPIPTVSGHDGNLIVGTVGGVRTLILQGRFHYYEGHSLETVTFPIRVLQCLGIRTVLLTAATGGIRPDASAGDIVCVTDHLNLIGANPLRGLNDERFGERFPDMSEVYSPRLRALAMFEAKRLGIALESGVYACLPGPSYETPAEIRMLRTLGADVVGMSTVPEAIVARHAGMEVLALALVTNAAAGVSAEAISHEDVLESSRMATPALGALLESVIRRDAMTR